MSEKTAMQKRVEDKPLSGVMVLLKNPKNGASINAPNICQGQHLKLPKGGVVIVDQTIAKAAQYVWGFLEIGEKLPVVTPAPKEEMEPELDEMENLVPADPSEMPAPGEQSAFIDGLSYNDMKLAASRLGVLKTSQMTKVMLTATLTGFGEEEVRKALESKEEL